MHTQALDLARPLPHHHPTPGALQQGAHHTGDPASHASHASHASGLSVSMYAPSGAEGADLTATPRSTGLRHRRTHSHDSAALASGVLHMPVSRARTSMPVGATPGLHNRTHSYSPSIPSHPLASVASQSLDEGDAGPDGRGSAAAGGGAFAQPLAAPTAADAAAGVASASSDPPALAAARCSQSRQAPSRSAPSGRGAHHAETGMGVRPASVAEGDEWVEADGDWGLLGSRPSGDVGAALGALAASAGGGSFVYDHGWLRASVVAPEIKLEGGDGFGPFGGKVEVVVYKIRVEVDTRCVPHMTGAAPAPQERASPASAAGGPAHPPQAPPHRNALITSWTVAHRYSDFEGLHTALGKAPATASRYKALGLAPPPKRLPMLNHDARFIARRREELDAYLQSLLKFPDLATSPDLLSFLRCPPHLRPQHSAATSPGTHTPALGAAGSRLLAAGRGAQAGGGAGSGAGGGEAAGSEQPSPATAAAASNATPRDQVVASGGGGASGAGTPALAAGSPDQDAAWSAAAVDASGPMAKLGAAMGAALVRIKSSATSSSPGAPVAAAAAEREDAGGSEGATGKVKSILARVSRGRRDQEGALGGSVCERAAGGEGAAGEDAEVAAGAGVPARETSTASFAATAVRASSALQDGMQRLVSRVRKGAPPRPTDWPAGSGMSVDAGAAGSGLAEVSQASMGAQSSSAGAGQAQSPGQLQGLRTSSTSGLVRPHAPSIATMVASVGALPGSSRGEGGSAGPDAPGAATPPMSASWPAPGQPVLTADRNLVGQQPAADTPTSTSGIASHRLSMSHTISGGEANSSGAMGAAGAGEGAAAGGRGSSPQPSGAGPGTNQAAASKGPRVAMLASGAAPSVPLYELVDTIFQLSSRGFFGRQVVAVARQLLSVVAGDAIDEAITAQIRAATSEHAIARHLLLLQRTLWPAGYWYAWAPSYQQQQQQAAQGGRGGQEGAQQPAAKPPPFVMRADAYMVPSVAPTQEETEAVIRQVRELLLGPLKPPGAIMGLLGRATYTAGITTLIEMASTPTLMFQMGYSLLEAIMVALAPELQDVIDDVHAGSVTPRAEPIQRSVGLRS